MAIKQKDQQQKSKLVEIITTDYKWLNLVLGLLAIFAIALSVMIINKSLNISSSFPILGKGNNGVIFAGFLLTISILGLVLVLFPFFYAAFPEIKRISWPKGKIYFDAVVRTFIFVILITLILMLFDYLVVQTISKLV